MAPFETKSDRRVKKRMLKIKSSAIRLAAGVVLINLFIYLLAGVSICKSRQHYERQAALTTQNLANSLELTIAGFLEKMDISLFAVKNETERQLAGGGINEKLLNAYITREKTVIPTFEEMWVADRDGNVRYGTKIISHQPVNITDREYFQRLRNNPGSGLVISKPVIGRITKTWSMLISKRINNPDGSFAGLAFGSLRFADYFDGLFSKINIGKQGVIEFRDQELALIDQYPDIADPRGQVGPKMVSTLILDKIQTEPNFGTYNTLFERDGIERTVSYKKITGYPFYVVVSLGRSEYLSAWRNEVAVALSLLLLFTLITAFSARMFFLRRVQGALQESDARYRELFNNANLAIFQTTLEGRIIGVNLSFAQMFGFISPEEVLTSVDNPADLFADSKRHEELIRLKAENPDMSTFDNLYRRKDGSTFIGNLSLRQVVDQNDDLLHFEGFIEDITERKAAEEKLRKREALFRAVVEHNHEGIVLMNAERRPLYVSPSYTQINGYSPEEWISGYGPDYVHPDDFELTANAFREVLQSPGKVVTTTYRLRHKMGHWFWVETVVTNLLHDPDIQAVVLNSRDITEQRRADYALRETESRFRAFVEQSPVAIGVFSLDGITLYANQKFLETLGLQNLEEVVGRPAVEYFSPQFREESKERTRRRLAGLPVPPEYESTFLRADGAEFPAHVAVAPIQLTSERVSIAFLTDISERKMAEQKLRERELHYKMLFEAIPESVLLIGTDRRVVAANRASALLYGYESPQQLEGYDTRLLIAERDRERASRIQADVLQGEERPPRQYIEVRHDGSEFIAEVMSTTLRGPGQEVTGYIGITRDITAFVKAEEALRESEQKYRLLAENSVTAVWTANFAGGFTYMSLAIEKLLGYTVDEVMQIQMAGIVVKEDYENLMMILSAELAKPKGERLLSYSQQIRCRRKDGNLLDAEINVTWLRDDQGDIVGLQGSTSDITERKIAEAEKAKLGTQLQQAQKMESVGRLAGGVAHDFNNMLGLIIGHTELALEQTDPTHPLHTDLQEIRKAAERSADLTRQLLAFARQQTAALKVLDLNEIITNMLKMLQRLIGEDIDLKWQSEANLWLVKMDPTQIDQILANLCINARDAISDTGKITIETGNITLNKVYCADHEASAPGEYVMLIVSDNGCGMDKETIEKIFEPFFTTKGVGKGTGLGLATVFGIVKQNNGFIYVYSEPGQGTTFTIYLPRHVGKAGQVQPEVKQAPAQRGQETILLVEDEPDILNLTKMLLERQGYTVLAANTPGKAISLAGEHVGEINLLMTDVVMPEMNGRDLAKHLLALYPHLKCLFTSGYTADVIAHHGVLDEGVHFIQKPFSIKALAAKVREALDQK